eukprot:superscaffoldBa00003532_g17155
MSVCVYVCVEGGGGGRLAHVSGCCLLFSPSWTFGKCIRRTEVVCRRHTDQHRLKTDGLTNQHRNNPWTRVENVTKEDEGFYHCEASNQKETVKSQPAFLLPAEMDWSFIQQPTNLTVKRGENVTFTCRPPYSRPTAQVSWFKNNKLLTPTAHINVLPSGDLFFHSVQEFDSGNYFCRASNIHLQRFLTSRRAALSVLAPPSVKLWPQVVTVPVGARVVLECQVSGHPLPSIRWVKRGQSKQTGGKIILGLRNATLFIQSARNYDEGEYVCEASNTLGQSRGTAMLRVAVSPIIVTSAGQVSCRIGASAVLPCGAIGILPITYTWTRGRAGTNSLISPTEDRHIDEAGALRISRVQWSDAGEYYCTAENRAGRHQRRTTLTVTAEDHPIDRGKQTRLVLSAVSLSDQVQLNISQQGHPVQSAKSANDTELTEWLKRNTSQSPMTSDDPRVTQQSPSWLPVLEKHDIPIVVGVGVSLAFIFITVTFYSVVQKNEPAPTSRAAQRNLGVPIRHADRRAAGRTYENRAFEDDDCVAVIEQSPNTSDTCARPPGPSLVTIDPSLEEEKGCSLSQPSIQLQCAEDCISNGGDNHSPCQDALPPPSSLPSRSPSPSPPSRREESLRSSVTLQSAEPFVAPIHHSLSISHGNPPLLLSHHVSLGLTTVAVDVHFYPAATASMAVGTSTHISSVSNSTSVAAPLFSPPLANSQENDQSTARLHQCK